MNERMSWEDVCRWISLCFVEAGERGKTQIVAGSDIHRAMLEFCRLLDEGRLHAPSAYEGRTPVCATKSFVAAKLRSGIMHLGPGGWSDKDAIDAVRHDPSHYVPVWGENNVAAGFGRFAPDYVAAPSGQIQKLAVVVDEDGEHAWIRKWHSTANRWSKVTRVPRGAIDRSSLPGDHALRLKAKKLSAEGRIPGMPAAAYMFGDTTGPVSLAVQTTWRVELAAVRRPDYVEREERCPARYTTCLLCGVPLVKPWPHVVQLVDGGRYIVPEDAPVDVTDPGYVGCWPIGLRCWQRLIAAVNGQQQKAKGD